jgi:tetratricopeptide (TPR) repeat protein
MSFLMKRTGEPLILLCLMIFIAAPVGAQRLDASDLVRAAREAAQADRNAESAELFRRAIEAEPRLRFELLREYADQLTYSERPRDAVPLYREVLNNRAQPSVERRRARLGLALALSWSNQLGASLREYNAVIKEDPRNIEALAGKARVLSWLDRLGESAAEYQRILALDPGNAEAEKHLGRVRAWEGRHREAVRLLRNYLRRYPEDDEARVLLARAHYWMGRSDLAREELSDVVMREPAHSDALSLLGELNRQSASVSRIGASSSTQSDDLDIRSALLEHDAQLAGGRTTVGLRYHDLSFEGRASEVSLTRPGLAARHRFSDSLEWNASVFRERIGAAQEYERTTYDTWLTLWPGDFLRFDLSTSRTTFDNLKSLNLGLTAEFHTVSVDILPSRLTRINARASYGDYSDGNSRWLAQLAATRRLLNRPLLLVGVRYTEFDFAQSFDHGYFNPETFQSAVATLQASGLAGHNLWFDLDGFFGIERADQTDRIASGVSVGATYPATRPLAAEIRYQYFDSGIATSSGFSRNTANVGLRYRW